jgi:uncharacterized protein
VTSSHHPVFVHPRVLKFNVGFLLAQGAGNQRITELDIPAIRLDDDLELEYVRGELRLSRNSRGILVQGQLLTRVMADCVRCLSRTYVPLEIEIEELYSFPVSADTAYGIDETGILDLAPLLREETILGMPMVVLCRADCAGLCPSCGQKLDEGACNCEHDTIDPRLAVLRTHLEIDNQSGD